MQSSSTIPLCSYCGRPVGWGDPSRVVSGVFYHFECTRPPLRDQQPDFIPFHASKYGSTHAQ